jgi:hypothetical protein
MSCRRRMFVDVVLDYAVPGPLTNLDGVPLEALLTVAVEPVNKCSPVHGLVFQPTDTAEFGLPEDRLAESQIRPASELVTNLASSSSRLLALDPTALSFVREPGKRVVGTCRHFGVRSCALLRYRGIEARVRCGFATYFHPGQGLDH